MASTWSRLRDHSRARSWAPGHGAEWNLLSGAASFTAAFHLLRFLCNGLPGRARHRPDHLRPPHACSRCARPSTHARATTSQLGPGVEWCEPCLGDWAGSKDRWAALPAALLPPPLRPAAAQIVARLGSPPPQLAPKVSPFRRCSLCGLGEAGAEHLWLWCSAVALFWASHRSEGAPTSFGDALLQPGEYTRLLAAMVHQIAHWHCIGLHCRPLGAAAAAAAMSRSSSRPCSRGR